jgi:hypothetical protein
MHCLHARREVCTAEQERARCGDRHRARTPLERRAMRLRRAERTRCVDGGDLGLRERRFETGQPVCGIMPRRTLTEVGRGKVLLQALALGGGPAETRSAAATPSQPVTLA